MREEIDHRGFDRRRILVAAGHTVYWGAHDETKGRKAAEEIWLRFVRLDVTDDASVAAVFEQFEADGGLAHSEQCTNRQAGVGREALDCPCVLEVFDTNAAGVVLVTEAAFPLLQKSDNRAAVNVSSAVGSFWATHEPSCPASYFVAIGYGSGKAAFSRTLRGFVADRRKCRIADRTAGDSGR